jgi:hypothetical protein
MQIDCNIFNLEIIIAFPRHVENRTRWIDAITAETPFSSLGSRLARRANWLSPRITILPDVVLAAKVAAVPVPLLLSLSLS